MRNPDYFGAAATALVALLTLDAFVNKEESLLRRLFRQLGLE